MLKKILRGLYFASGLQIAEGIRRELTELSERIIDLRIELRATNKRLDKIYTRIGSKGDKR